MAAPVNPARIAILDVGTNTFHLLVLEIHDRHRHSVVEKYRQPVKLGEGGITTGEIAPPAFARGLEAMRKYKSILDAHQVETVYALATSAVRSARNGLDFIGRVRAETGIDIRVINGNEEAALIYLGVQSGLQLPLHEDVLLMDIGGGSVEFIVADATLPKFLRSVDIGAARLLAHVNPDDVITPTQLDNARLYINDRLGDLFQELRQFNLKTLVGSSGSFETFGALLAARDPHHPTAELNGYTFSRAAFQEIHAELLAASRAERLAMKGMEPMRVEMIGLSSLLAETIIEGLGIEQIQVSLYALKEGILAQHLKRLKFPAPGSDARAARSKLIEALARHYSAPETHTHHVAFLAERIFDQLTQPYGLLFRDRELLTYAAWLYPIGQHINRSGYHKHGQYLINHSELRGFSSTEQLLLSNLVRYHRKSLPSAEHMHFSAMVAGLQHAVRRLAGILRIAINLDRTQRGIVKDITLEVGTEKIALHVHAQEDPALELEAVREETELFEEAFDRRLEFHWVKASKPVPVQPK